MTALNQNPVVAVGGDVCIDWLSIPVEPVAVADGQPNWRLRGGEHMFAERGGAWLTADLTAAALGNTADVVKPEKQERIENVAPDDVIHSLLRLRKFRAGPKDESLRWRVAKFEGFSGPLANSKKPPFPACKMERAVLAADLVLLDDAGNGFRDFANAWPEVVSDTTARPVIIYKVRRPLAQGALWKRVKEHHAQRTVMVLTADELRASGATISRGLSWERTAFETWQAVAYSTEFEQLRACAWIVVTHGLEGALLVNTKDGMLDAATQWFSPLLSEGDIVRSSHGDMTGFGSAFSAALAASLIADSPIALDRGPLSAAVKKGMLATRRMLEAGFGTTEEDDSSNPAPTKGMRIRAPRFPTGAETAKEIFSGKDFKGFPLTKVRLPALQAGISREQVTKQRHWRILDQLRGEPMATLAARLLIQGHEKALPEFPRGVFGKLVTVDRAEIESYRSVRNLMLEYVRLQRPERPLCLAVFGQPGTGKSFGVTEVALDVAAAVKDTSIEKIEFNVSQWESPEQFVQALHRVRDFAIRGKVPLVFFDEFDSSLLGMGLGWLKSFLAPMQDGVFSDGHFDYQIGRAIFVFAGGTAHTFADFVCAHGRNSAAKVPDFLSRLRGHVDVFGFRTPTDTNLIRRAVVLRIALWKKFPGLFDSYEDLRIEPSVVTAILNAPEYRHGARSIEAIVEMSRLVGYRQFESSSLPPEVQLDEHADASAFMRMLARPRLPEEKLEAIAKAIHEHYLATQMKAGKQMDSRPALRRWDELDALYQNSNREQAADYANKLAAIDAEISRDIGEPFAFTKEEIQPLAEKEHERWMEERRIVEPHHPAMKPWAELPEDEKDKDRESITAMPGILKSVGLAVRRIG